MSEVSEFPALREAMLTIRHDIGCGGRTDCHPLSFPDSHAQHAPIVDAFLAPLDAEALSVFCSGEESEMKEMCSASNAAQLAHDFLNDFFHGFDPELCVLGGNNG
tara:strand:- start:39684 stop:39998 length:315 start_codon:yes stop_codon:yes gene_type:complete